MNDLTPIGHHFGGEPRRTAITIGRPLPEGSALCEMPFRETDQRLQAALEAISEGPIRTQVSMRFPEGEPPYPVVERIGWTLPPENAPEARRLLSGSMRSAPESRLLDALYRLRKNTKARENDSSAEGKAAEAAVWVEQLRGYPADVVLETLREWPSRRNGMWWPTWHEIEKILRARSGFRQALANRLASLERPL